MDLATDWGNCIDDWKEATSEGDSRPTSLLAKLDDAQERHNSNRYADGLLPQNTLYGEAADEIRRLRADNDRLRCKMAAGKGFDGGVEWQAELDRLRTERDEARQATATVACPLCGSLNCLASTSGTDSVQWYTCKECGYCVHADPLV